MRLEDRHSDAAPEFLRRDQPLLDSGFGDQARRLPDDGVARRRAAFVACDLRAGSGFQLSDTPFSIQRRMAADRVIARSAAHASTRLISSRGSRIARTGSRPVAGLPLFFGNTFLLDRAMFLVIPLLPWGCCPPSGGQPGGRGPVVGVGRPRPRLSRASGALGSVLLLQLIGWRLRPGSRTCPGRMPPEPRCGRHNARAGASVRDRRGRRQNSLAFDRHHDRLRPITSVNTAFAFQPHPAGLYRSL